jgi:hypothetical protein
MQTHRARRVLFLLFLRHEHLTGAAERPATRGT